MSIGPNPVKILELETELEQGLAVQHDFDSLLNTLLPLLAESWPAIRSLQLYHPISSKTLRLLAFTGDAGNETVANKGAFARVLKGAELQQEDGRWLLPINDSRSVSAVLAVQIDDASPEAQAWLQWAAQQLSRALKTIENQSAQARMQQQLTQIFAGLSVHQSLDDMLRLVQSHLFPSLDVRLSVFRLLFDSQGQACGLRLKASTGNNPVEWDVHAAVIHQPIMDQNAARLDLSDPQMQDALGPGVVEKLHAQGIQQIALWPLIIENNVVALWSVEQQDSAPFSDLQWTAFLRVAERLSMLYQARQLMADAQATRAIADNLVLSSRLITTADSYDDMAHAAVYTIARNMAAVAVTLFDVPLDADTRPAGRMLVALGLADNTVDNLESAFVPLLPDEDQLEDLWQGQPVVVNGSPDDGFALAAQYYDRLVAEHRIAWLAAFGLRAGDQILGTLEILHWTVHELSIEEVDAYNTLADQIGVSVRNRQLLQEAEKNLEETRLLYELNQELIVSQDMLELLRVLRLVASDADLIIHSTLEYDSQHQLVDVVYRHILKPDTEQVFQQSVAAELGPQGIERIKALAGEITAPVFVEDTGILSAEQSLVIEGPIQISEVASLVLIPVHERGVLRDLVRVTFKQPQHFDDRTRRLFQTAQGQMEIVLQSLRFLQATQTSAVSLGKQVSVLQTLNELSTVITVATDEDQLLNQSVQALVVALEIDYGQVCLLDPVLENGEIVSEYPPEKRVGTLVDARDLLVRVFPNPDRPQARVVADISTSEFLDEVLRVKLQAEKVKSFLLLPLLVRQRLAGYIRLDIRQAGQRFNQDMLGIAQTIMVQVMIGLQNIRLLNESNRRSEQLQMVSSFAQMLQASLDTGCGIESGID